MNFKLHTVFFSCYSRTNEDLMIEELKALLSSYHLSNNKEILDLLRLQRESIAME